LTLAWNSRAVPFLRQILKERRMAICDGCGAQVDDVHIRQRIERLELATRFRPIHISVLLIDAAPPARLEDYFYRATNDRSERTPASREYFDELVRCAGAAAGEGVSEDSALAEFQRHGFFLIGAMECAVEGEKETAEAIKRNAAKILRRVNVSYKPKSVALLSSHTQPLIAMFHANGWGERLILKDGKPTADLSSTGRLASVLGRMATD
jgi:hypothetical protein